MKGRFFYPTKNFSCDVMKSQYIKGERYTLRAGNDKLAKQVAAWDKKGLVIVGPETEVAAAPIRAAVKSKEK